MGAYLSEPLTTKDSSEEANDLLACGSSSMQGWRISQEDAHNCILNYDDKTSFFAVYDGHGGAEVAQYCSLNLPKFLKQLKSYKNKDFEQALKDAFLGFDATLLDEKVIEELKRLSDKTNGEEAVEEDDEEEEDDNVDDLCKEACMPLNEVLQMYKKDKKNPALAKIKEGNCSKPLSPYLKGKRKGLAEGDEPGPSSSSAGSSAEADASKDKKTGGSDAVDSTVSSSSNKTEETAQKPESSTADKKAEQSDEISDTDGVIAKKTKKEECAPDSSSTAPTVNGEVGESASKSAVSSSSVVAQENGEVSSNTAAGGSKNMPDLPAGSSSSGKSAASVDSSSAGSSSSASAAETAGSKKRKAKNGAPNVVQDDSDDDDSETDEEFPPVQDSNENSSTEDGEEDHYCEEESEEEEDDEEGEGEYDEEEEDYMNEEDEAFMNNITDEPGKDSGCTAVVALLHDKELFVANAGDSRCVVCRNGKALEMSIDHKPEDQVEFERIQKAGGRVTLDGRVNGGLNLSRAIGDHGYKMNKKVKPEEQMISALPDIKKITIEPEDEFMVLACDGIWNFMTSDDVVEFVQDRLADPTKKLTDICEEMFDYCLAPHTKGDGTGCDNMTAIIVQFKPNFTGAASRKRACSPAPGTDCKKPKTDSTASNGDKCETTSNNDEKEAAAAVASIESSTSSAPMDTDENIASSST